MPKYTYECPRPECKLRFDRRVKASADNSVHACPDCGEPSPRVWEGSTFGFGFGGAPKTDTPANSGVHDHDYPTADKAVGRSADRRWEHLEGRQKAKDGLRRDAGTHALTRRSGEGYVEYAALSPDGLNLRKKRAKKAEVVFRAAEEAK